MTQDRSTGERRARRLFFLVDPQRRSGTMSPWVNPVMVKEFRTRRFGRSHWTLRLIALSAILSLGLSYVAAAGALGWGIEMIGGALVLLQTALLAPVRPEPGGRADQRRARGRRLAAAAHDAAVAGRHPPRQAAERRLAALLLLCATLPGYVVMMTVKPELAPQVARVVICLALTAVFAVLVGAAASSLFRSTATATAAAYLVLVGVCVGPLLVWLGRDAPFGHRTVEAALTISPVAAALHASETPGFTEYDLLPANWWLIGGSQPRASGASRASGRGSSTGRNSFGRIRKDEG